VWALAANLHMVGLAMHHRELIFCGVVMAAALALAMWWRHGALELTLQANKRATHAYTSCNAYATRI